MARQRSSGTGSAEESSDAPLEELESGAEVVDEDEAIENEVVVDEEEPVDDETAVDERSAATDALWTDVRMQPVEIALPSGVGYTLRAYRLSTEVRPPDISSREDDFPIRSSDRVLDEELDEKTVLSEIDEDELTAQALAAAEDAEEADRLRGRHRADDEAAEDDADVDSDDADVDSDVEASHEAEAEADDEADADDDGAEDEPEEVPVFLAEDGKLLLFRSAEGLVEYVRSATTNEFDQLDTWAELRERIEPEDIVPLDDDRYELDLVVENLRGGHDVWDSTLIIQAGEIARDVAFALRLQPVMTALSPGSPLDDMDDGLRTVEAGGFGSFFARRKLRKIDAQTTAALGWRTIIGKISAAVDWRN